jgi:hypothetical protein
LGGARTRREIAPAVVFQAEKKGSHDFYGFPPEFAKADPATAVVQQPDRRFMAAP